MCSKLFDACRFVRIEGFRMWLFSELYFEVVCVALLVFNGVHE